MNHLPCRLSDVSSVYTALTLVTCWCNGESQLCRKYGPKQHGRDSTNLQRSPHLDKSSTVVVDLEKRFWIVKNFP